MSRIRDIRINKNIKAIEMAEILGLSKANYSKKENGHVKFSLLEAKKVADKLGMKIDELFFDSKVTKNETIQEGA